MALFRLKSLGLTDDEIIALRNAVSLQHTASVQNRNMQTACQCICGNEVGGPAGSKACLALAVLEEAAKEMVKLRKAKKA
jgi:hypothetical protein